MSVDTPRSPAPDTDEQELTDEQRRLASDRARDRARMMRDIERERTEKEQP